ncbi:MAG: hypothetical protein LBE18_12070 [Planctomycetaceae bacterium]|jgi:hypothetical protein|nr:hypothetical protein [Planctomycetaceae bacterium]
MTPNNERVQKIQNLVKRGDWKKAYKEAKFSLKLSNSPEIKSLAVMSLWLWIKDQVKRNQYEEAKINVRELMHLGTESIPLDIKNEFTSIFPLLGLTSLLSDDLKNDTTSAKIQTQLLDQYIIHNSKSADMLPETLEAAEQIKKTFQLIESRQDTKATEILAAIPFKSPAAEWKLLIRGLIAHYNDDNKTATECWQRLNNSRPTHKIASNLQNLFRDKNNVYSNNDIVKQFNLFKDKSISSQSSKIDLIDNLRIINDCLKLGKYKDVLFRLPIIRQTAQSQHARMYGRILYQVYVHLLKRAQPVIVRQFIEQNLPLPLDPHGNRTFAILINRLIKTDMEIPLWLRQSGLHIYWKKFAEEDVDLIESFSPQMKSRAKSIAFYEIIDNAREALMTKSIRKMIISDLNKHNYSSVDSDEDYYGSDWFTFYYKKAIDADPTNIIAFEDFESFLQMMQEPEKADGEKKAEYEIILNDLYKQIFQHNTGDIKLLYQLFDTCISRNKFDDSVEILANIENLNKISKNTIYRKLKLTIFQCRQALQKNDLINTEKYITVFDNIQNIDPIYYRYNLVMLALKFIFSIRKENIKQAKEILSNHKKHGFDNILPIIFAVLFETRRIKISSKIVKNLENLFYQEVQKPPKSSSVGAISDLLSGVFDNSTEITYKDDIFTNEHVQKVFNYIKEIGRIRWKKEKDITGVCTFIWHYLTKCNSVSSSNKQTVVKLFQRLAKRGKSLFPNSPILTFLELESLYCNIDLQITNVRFFRAFKKKKVLDKRLKEFTLKYGKSKENPEISIFIAAATEKLKKSINEDAVEQILNFL